MSLSGLMKTPVQTIAATAKIAEAAHLMMKHSVGALVIVEGAKPVGMVTDRDLVRMIAEGLDANQASLDALVRPPLVTASVDDDLSAITEKMHNAGVRRLPVLAADGSLAGVVSLDDIVVLLGHELSEIGREVSHLSGALKTEFLHEDGVKFRSFLIKRS